MRKRFEQQNELDAQLIPDVKIDGKSRHELPQLLAGLQYIFVTPELNEAVFAILEKKVLGDKKATGRLGLSLWEILVLGTMRLNLDADYDTVYDLANHHQIVRGILGVHTRQVFGEGKYYPLQTLKDNLALLDEETLKEISEVVVKAGHQLKKNENGERIELMLKADTYAVESNVHFPTDMMNDIHLAASLEALAYYHEMLEKHIDLLERRVLHGEVIMPAKGPKPPEQQAEEETRTFVALRKKHSAVESNINELEHSGANRVPDKGLPGFKKYVALGVLAYNVRRLGRIVIEQGLFQTVIRPGRSARPA